MAAGVIDLLTQAIWMMRSGLEEDKLRGSPSAAVDSDRDILTAAMYIEYAGPLLLEKVLWNPKPELGDEDKRLLKGGPLYAGQSGLSSDRWVFWKKRFEEVAAAAEGGEETTVAAKKAALRAARLIEVWVETRMQLPH